MSDYEYIKWDAGIDLLMNNSELTIAFILAISYYKIISGSPITIDECIEKFENDVDVSQWEGDEKIIATLDNLHMEIINKMVSLLRKYEEWKKIEQKIIVNPQPYSNSSLKRIVDDFLNVEIEIKEVFLNGSDDFMKQYKSSIDYMTRTLSKNTQSPRWREITGWEELTDDERKACVDSLKKRRDVIASFKETLSYFNEFINGYNYDVESPQLPDFVRLDFIDIEEFFIFISPAMLLNTNYLQLDNLI